jgi:hypothetical protein
VARTDPGRPSLPNVNQHPAAIDVLDLQVPELGVAHPRGVQQHQHSAMRKAVRRLDQPRHVINAQDLRQPARDLRVRRVREELAALRRLHEEEGIAQTCSFTVHGASFRSRRRYAW